MENLDEIVMDLTLQIIDRQGFVSARDICKILKDQNHSTIGHILAKKYLYAGLVRRCIPEKIHRYTRHSNTKLTGTFYNIFVYAFDEKEFPKEIE